MNIQNIHNLVEFVSYNSYRRLTAVDALPHIFGSLRDYLVKTVSKKKVCHGEIQCLDLTNCTQACYQNIITTTTTNCYFQFLLNWSGLFPQNKLSTGWVTFLLINSYESIEECIIIYHHHHTVSTSSN